MQVALTSLGCRLNEAELERWAAGFQADGHQLTNSVENADLLVVNTCAVTQEAVKKSRQLIRRSHRHNAKAKLVVSGCYVSLQPEIENELAGIDLIINNHEKDQLVNIVKQRLAIDPVPKPATGPEQAALFARGRNRAFVKVQDGCRHKCTFCIVTVARGEERSRAVADIVDEINGLHAQNIREVILTGVHLGGYGSDLNTDLPALIKAALAETDVPRIRLGSVEPWDLDEHFFDLFDNPRFMPHLHLPLQSGSDTVLRRMGRRCKTSDFENLVKAAKEAVPDMNVTTDVIVGFPGETDEEWRHTLDFCRGMGENMRLSHIHAFPYSRRNGTRAAILSGQVPASVKKHRCRQLHSLSQQLKHGFMSRYAGQSFPVLVENNTGVINDQPVRFGYSPNYLRVAIPVAGGDLHGNTIKTVHIDYYDKNSATLMAQPMKTRDSKNPASSALL